MKGATPLGESHMAPILRRLEELRAYESAGVSVFEQLFVADFGRFMRDGETLVHAADRRIVEREDFTVDRERGVITIGRREVCEAGDDPAGLAEQLNRAAMALEVAFGYDNMRAQVAALARALRPAKPLRADEISEAMPIVAQPRRVAQWKAERQGRRG